MRAALAGLLVAALGSTAVAGDDDFTNTAVVFVRGASLIKSDAKGRNETEIATLPAKAGGVRALHTDALGKILLADVGGTWSWMSLDGSTKTLTDLPCEAGPAQLSDDGRYVFCRKGTGSLVVNLVTGKLTPLPVPTLGARLLGDTGNTRKLVWADKGAVWAAVAPKLANPTKVAPQAPLRGLLPSPDGTHALGVYAGEVYESVKKKKAGDVLMVFALDGQGAQRKAIQNGVPVDWSRDSKWVLVQDGASACIMLVAGGQYKCWRGYTAVSISPDGRYALVLGNRSSDGDKSDKKSDKKSAKKSKNSKKSDRKKKNDDAGDDSAGDATDATREGEAAEGDTGDEPLPTDDVAVAPPTGPRSLYRAQLEGAYTTSPALVARVVEGAAVWIPTPSR